MSNTPRKCRLSCSKTVHFFSETAARQEKAGFLALKQCTFFSKTLSFVVLLDTQLKGRDRPISTQMYLDAGAGHTVNNVQYSSILMSGAEAMFLSGEALYPVERTLLVSDQPRPAAPPIPHAGLPHAGLPHAGLLPPCVVPCVLFGAHLHRDGERTEPGPVICCSTIPMHAIMAVAVAYRRAHSDHGRECVVKHGD